MISQDFRKKKLPDAPGVYFFFGSPKRSEGGSNKKQILYIGRATSLRSRVRSYFAKNITEVRSPLIQRMVLEAKSVDWRQTDSVLEALLLEADLIKKFQPKYNTDEKDDKSFNCVVITKEDFPQVLIVRKKDLDFDHLSHINGQKFSALYGPFPNGGQLKDALKIIRRIFPYRDNKCVPCTTEMKSLTDYSSILQNTEICKACFNRHIGLCPGVCTGEISKEEYARTIRNLKLFFSGKKGRIVKNLKRDMKAAAEAREFERAGEIKQTIFALEHIQDVALIKTSNVPTYQRTSYRVEAYDIAHLSGTDVVGVMVVVENGVAKKSDYRKFKIRGGFGNNDTASLREVVERRVNHPEWPLPALCVADGGGAQKSAIEETLKTRNLSIPVVAVVKNERHRPEKVLGESAMVHAHEHSILLANAEAHRFALSFHRKRRARSRGGPF